MKRRSAFLLSMLLVLFVSTSPGEASDRENGAFGSYLVGTVDLHADNYTVIQIINPTSNKIKLLVGFFKSDGTPTGCQRADLQPNALQDLIVRGDTTPTKPLAGKGGIVKIVSLDPVQGEKIVEGVLGFQRHYFQSGMAKFGSERYSESNLAAVPKEILLENDTAELKKIMGSCRP